MAAPAASPELQQRIRETYARTGSISATARALGVQRATVRKYANDISRATASTVEEEPADPIREAQERRERARELRREREELEAVAGERSLRAELERLVRDTAPRLPPVPQYREPKRAPGATEETLLLMLSDWHAYEVVRPERTLNLNEYNADIFGRRAWKVANGVCQIADKMRAGGGWRFPRLVVAANGDMISGTIHEVEHHSDAPDVMRAVWGCAGVLAQAVRDLSTRFEDVTVFGTSGNHGRLPDHKRVNQKTPSRSWDFLIYLMASQMCADLKNVRFVLPDSYAVVYELEGWRFCQSHGHDIKSWQSIPFYGISRAATGLNALRVAAGSPIHYFLYSHFHNPGSITAPGSEYFVNGSLIGGTEFSVNGLGRCDKPCQWLLGVHRDYGVTHRWPILADGAGASGAYDVRPWAV